MVSAYALIVFLCLVSFTTGAVRSAMPAIAGFLVSLVMDKLIYRLHYNIGLQTIWPRFLPVARSHSC